MSSPEHKAKIWEMISDIGTCMMVTEDDEELRARPMQLVQDEYDGTIWFYTRLSSPKAFEIYKDRRVCLTFACPKDKTYVSMTGVAKINTDQKLIDKYWSSHVSAWFPEGKESKNCGLIEIKINHGEHWDSTTGKLGYMYEIMKANITNNMPNVSENEKF